jgi:hypothetical protein
MRKFSTTFRTAHHWVTSQHSTIHSSLNLCKWTGQTKLSQAQAAVCNVKHIIWFQKPKIFPVIAVQNNLKKHEKNATLFLINANTFWKHETY